MPNPLETEFHSAMLNIYDRAKNEADYPANRFLDMLRDRSGVDVAKQLIPQISYGFSALWEKNRLDLTMEALIVDNPEFHTLFSPQEIETCRNRLRDCRYNFGTAQGAYKSNR